MRYGAHLKRAWSIGGALLGAGGACFIHGLFPGLFADRASRTIVKLNDEVKKSPAHEGQSILIEFEI